MKAVLISTSPEHCELIANHKETIIIRKNKPKLETSFKCYIYCTKGFGNNKKYSYKTWARYGRVIGEFVCDEITEYPYETFNDGEHFMPYGELEKTCLDGWELYDYLGIKDGYGWHISDLIIYDKPKKLSEFHKPCEETENCLNKNFREAGHCLDKCFDCGNRIKRPPHSWCYIEELVGDYE